MRIFAKPLGWVAIAVALVAMPMAAHAYSISGQILCQPGGFPLYGGEARAYEVDPVPGGSFTTELLFAVPVTTSGNFVATVTWPTGGPGFEAGDPDLIFEIVQTVDGTTEVVYQELSSSARWNVPDGSNFVLESDSSLAVCPDPALGPGSNPADGLFLFTRIGVAETADIDCRGSDPGAEGYWRPRKAPFSFTGTDTDQPFGRTLDLFAWFGQLVNVDYYRIQFSSDGGSSWSDFNTSLPNKWYDTGDPNPLNWHWVSQSMGPFSVGAFDNLYQIPYFVRPATPWSWYDRVGRFDTTKVPDGLSRLRIEAYKWSGGSLVLATSSDLMIDVNYGEITLQVDNTPPTVEILNLKLNNAIISPCDIGNLGVGATDKLSIDFRVRDARGHLRDYTLDALYGHACHVTPRPAAPDPASDDYDHNASGSPSWQGSLGYTTDYVGSVYLSGSQVDCSSMSPLANQMPTCAYQFRLRASKRTTNGYGLIYHYVEDTWHVTVQRP